MLAADPEALDSDIWLCKSHLVIDGAIVPVWSPPEGLDDFVSASAGKRLASRQPRETRCSAALLDSLVSEQPVWSDEAMFSRCNEAVGVYLKIHELARPPRYDPGRHHFIVALNQSLAWLETAVGVSLASLTLERIERVARSVDAPLAEAMYGVPQRPPTFGVVPTPGGQSELWRECWGWLSQDTIAEYGRRTIAMSAALLANPAVVYPLAYAAKDGDRRSTAEAKRSLRRTPESTDEV